MGAGGRRWISLWGAGHARDGHQPAGTANTTRPPSVLGQRQRSAATTIPGPPGQLIATTGGGPVQTRSHQASPGDRARLSHPWKGPCNPPLALSPPPPSAGPARRRQSLLTPDRSTPPRASTITLGPGLDLALFHLQRFFSSSSFVSFASSIPGGNRWRWEKERKRERAREREREKER